MKPWYATTTQTADECQDSGNTQGCLFLNNLRVLFLQSTTVFWYTFSAIHADFLKSGTIVTVDYYVFPSKGCVW